MLWFDFIDKLVGIDEDRRARSATAGVLTWHNDPQRAFAILKVYSIQGARRNRSG